MKKIVPILAVALLSILIVFVSPSDGGIQVSDALVQAEVSSSLLKQSVIDSYPTPVEITKIYDQTTLIGVITDQQYVDRLLDDVYTADYEADFPNTELGFNEDIYVTKELSYVRYENKDDEIFEYIEKNEKFAVLTNKVTFSNGAIIYVKSVDDFEEAKRTFLLNFVSESSYDLFQKKLTTPELTTYGYREVSLRVEESVEITQDLAPKSEILIDQNAIVYYLSYGVNPNTATTENKKIYTVQSGDTVAGIAWINDITVKQLMSTNADIIFNEDQVLVAGTELNVTEFNSLFNVFVTKERLYQEVVEAPATKYVPDDSLPKGQQKVSVVEESGLKNVKRLEVYLNGILTDNSAIVSEVTTKAPVQGIILYGTYVEPSTGTGTFRAPVANYIMTCGYGCYAGHKGADYQNRYQRWEAAIYAGDTGTVTAAGWGTGGYGYRVIIDHGNGLVTLYAHMISSPPVSVGQVVSKGTVIGYVGSTGSSTAPHVHVEVRRNGAIQNPCGYFPC